MSGIEAADVYKIIEFVGRGMTQFAREKLRLTETEIEECEHYGRDNLREIRFQMVQTWMRKEGRYATKDRLNAMAGGPLTASQQHTSASADCYQKYSESPISSNSQGASTSMKAPVSDDTDKHEKSKSRPGSQVLASTGIQNTAGDIAPIKAFGSEKTPERQHKRTDSGSVSISSTSASSDNLGSAESVARKKKRSLSKKLKQLNPFKLMSAKGKDVPKAFSQEEAAPGAFSDPVHWGKVKTVTDEDLECILKITNRYKTEDKRGCALILNNGFWNQTDLERQGADKDVKNMEELWRQIGCDIYGGASHQEQTASEMRKLLSDMTKLTKKYSYIVVVIMTHGSSEDGSVVFKGVDNASISVEEIEKTFNNKNAPRLLNIPKFFIFQFCCGKRLDRGVDTNYHRKFKKAFKRMASIDASQKHEVVRTDGGKAPTSSDMHFAYATHKDHVALRSPSHGSLFITAITNVFMEHARCENVHNMLLRVHEAMKSKFGVYTDEMDGKEVTFEVNAMSWSGGSFTKQLFLLPGYHRPKR